MDDHLMGPRFPENLDVKFGTVAAVLLVERPRLLSPELVPFSPNLVDIPVNKDCLLRQPPGPDQPDDHPA
jgi:hypothetical protein